MRIVVTGITGFIGRNLLETIRDDGNEYLCLVRGESDLSECSCPDNIVCRITNFSSEDLCERLTGAEVVLHMAGQMGAYGIPYEQFEEVNYLLTKRIVEACSAANVKQLIYISTPGVIGLGKRLSTEDAPYAPRNPYEQTKMQAELAVLRGGGKLYHFATGFCIWSGGYTTDQDVQKYRPT